MTVAEEEAFWAKQRPESRIKALLVSEYFPQYCRIIKPKSKGDGFIYLDFWAGRGKYADGSYSTPLLLGEIISKDPELRGCVQFVFNDLNNMEILRKNFEEQFPPGTFAKEPRFGKYDVTSSPELKDYLNRPPKASNNPALLFFDPFGYEGIETRSLANFLKPFGNELFLFLNVNRVLPAMRNPKMTIHIDAIFPTLRTKAIDDIYALRDNERRVGLLVRSLAQEFRSILGDSLRYCAFKFMEDDCRKTSHVVIHFCKNARGYNLAKQVFYDYDNYGSVLGEDGMFAFDAKAAYQNGIQSLFGDFNLQVLADELVKQFKGHDLSAYDLIENHSPTSPYARSHYVGALRLLVEEQKLKARYTDGGNHKVTVLPSKTCQLTFPE